MLLCKIFITFIIEVNMGLFDKLFNSNNSFDSWLENATYKELADGYEERRLEYIKNGGGDRTPEMRKIEAEMVKRSNEQYEREHPNAEPRHREHGW